MKWADYRKKNQNAEEMEEAESDSKKYENF